MEWEPELRAAHGDEGPDAAALLREANEQLLLSALREQDLAEQLQQQLSLLDAITTSLAGGIVAYDLAGLITFVNPAAARMLGWEPHALVGQPIQATLSEATTPEHPAAPDNPFLLTLRTASIASNDDADFLRQDGTRLPVAYTITPILREGQVDGGVVSFQDMTRILRLQQAREEYLALLSHDLRTPLTLIIGRSELLQERLRRHGLDAEARMATAIAQSSQRMNALIQTVLDLNQLEQHGALRDQTPLDLAALSAEVLAQLEALAASRRIELTAPEPLVVWGNQAQLERVVLNLLSNALKYAAPDTRVQVCLWQTETEVMLSVTDQGVGIPADDLPHLFEKHYRVKAHRDVQGTGLGLYISRLIVEAHGGRIQVASTVGQGSTFTVTLPRFGA